MTRGPLVDGILVIAQQLAPNIEAAQGFAVVADTWLSVVDDPGGKLPEKEVVKRLVHELDIALQTGYWPPTK